MGICVKIEIDDNGQISVGQEPEEQEQPGADQGAQGGGQQQEAAAGGGADDEAAEKQYMNPVRSVDEALAMAKQLLAQAQSGTPQGQAQAQEQQGFESGFNAQAPQSIAGLMK